MLRDAITDEYDIRKLLMRYTMCGDRGDLEGLASCFGDQGTLKFPRAEATGAAAIRKVLSEGKPNNRLKRLRHHLTSSQILFSEADPIRANGRTYFLTITNAGPDHSGVYVDTFTKASGQWEIARREVRIDWQSETSVYERFPGL